MKLFAHAKYEKKPKNHTLFKAGNTSNRNFYIILKGKVFVLIKKKGYKKIRRQKSLKQALFTDNKSKKSDAKNAEESEGEELDPHIH